jgi:hypothetical protein
VKVRSTPIVMLEANEAVLAQSIKTGNQLPNTPGLPDLSNLGMDGTLEYASVPLGKGDRDSSATSNGLKNADLATRVAVEKSRRAQEKTHLMHERTQKRATAYELHSQNVKILPMQLKMSQTQPHIPQGQQEIIRHQEMLREQIVASYGLPASMVLFAHNAGQKTSAKVADEQDLMVFYRTIKEYKKIALTIFHELYQYVYGVEKANSMLFDVKLNISQLAQPDQLLRAHSQGLISEETLKENLLDAIGIDPIHALKGPANIKLVPVNGTERHTTASMEAELEIKKAQAEKERATAKKILAEAGALEGTSEQSKAEYDLEKLKQDGQVEMIKLNMEFEKMKQETERIKGANQIKAAKQSASKAKKAKTS